MELLKEHSGKTATLAGGGLSLGAAMYLFVSIQAFNEHKAMNAQTHQQVQELDAKVDNLMLIIMGNVSTNSARGSRVPQ